jgi:hypothetical protein
VTCVTYKPFRTSAKTTKAVNKFVKVLVSCEQCPSTHTGIATVETRWMSSGKCPKMGLFTDSGNPEWLPARDLHTSARGKERVKGERNFVHAFLHFGVEVWGSGPDRQVSVQWRLLWTRWWTVGFNRRRGNPWPAELLSACQVNFRLNGDVMPGRERFSCDYKYEI